VTVAISGQDGILRNVDYQTPTTGFSYTVASGIQVVILKPLALLAAGTVTMPLSPSDWMTVTISTTQTITALTLSPNTGQSVSNAITTLLAGGAASYLYRAADTTWYRVG